MKLIEEAFELIEYGKVDKGLKQLEEVLITANVYEKYTIADTYYQFGFLEEAKELLVSLKEEHPEESEFKLLLAEVYIDLDDEESAISLLDEIDENDEEYHRALILLADFYQMQGLDEVAEQKLLKAKSLLPTNPIILFALGDFYSGRGNYNQSIPFYEKVLKEQDKLGDININLRLADSYAATGRFEEAFIHYEKGLEDKVEIDSLFGYACAAFQAEKYKTVINKLVELKEMDPAYSPLYLVLAKAFEAEELLTEAEETVMEGLEVDEYNKELFIYGGKLAIKMKQTSKGKKWLEKALELDHESTEAGFLLTRLYMSEGDYEKVELLIENTMANGDEDPQMLWDLATAKKELEQYSDALKQYHAAYTFFKEQPDFLEEYGYFLWEEGLREEAIERFKELLQLDKTRIDIENLILEHESGD